VGYTISRLADIGAVQGTPSLGTDGQQLHRVLGLGQFQVICESEAIICDGASSLEASSTGGRVHPAPIPGPSGNAEIGDSSYVPSDAGSIIVVLQVNDGQFLDLDGGEPVLSLEEIEMFLPENRAGVPAGDGPGGASGDPIPGEPTGGIGGGLVSEGLD
jgi:hypothetical protein